MNKLSQEKKERLMMVGVASLGLVAVLYFFVIGAQKATLADLALKTEAVQQKLTKAEFWVRNRTTILGNLDKNRDIAEEKEKGTAPLDKLRWFLNTLNQFKTGYAVDLENYTDPESADVGVLPKFPYSAAVFGVEFTAYYEDFGRFLADFENHFPYMRVQNIDIRAEASTRMQTQEIGAEAEPPGEKLLIKMKVVTLVKPSTL
jgi:hypothetical protein